MIRWSLLIASIVFVGVGLLIAQPNVKKTGREVYDEGFSAPDAVSDSVQAKRMKDLIARLNNMAVPTTKKKTNDEPVKLPDSKNLDMLPTREIKTTTPPMPRAKSALTEKVLTELSNKVPEEIAEPVRLADALYAAGHHADAYKFYEAQLKKTKDVSRRSWLLYQMGNSIQRRDIDKAMKHYQMLLSENPKSIWVGPTRQKIKLLAWFKKNRPVNMLEDIERVTNPTDLDDTKPKTAAESTALQNKLRDAINRPGETSSDTTSPASGRDTNSTPTENK